jgi:hypothetical protein
MDTLSKQNAFAERKEQSTAQKWKRSKGVL